MSKFVILLGGSLTVSERVRRQIAGARVIAADAGIRHAAALGVVPELWAGDFDSASDNLLGTYDGVEKAVYPADKDLTDGEIAIEHAIENGASELVIAGAFGGDRADHGFLTLAAAPGLRRRIGKVVLTSGHEEAVPLLPGHAHVADYEPGTLFSILAFSDIAGLTLRGSKWDLDKRDVPLGSSLVISNEVRDSLSVNFEDGQCLLYAQFGIDKD